MARVRLKKGPNSAKLIAALERSMVEVVKKA
jgi:hypothetical protein